MKCDGVDSRNAVHEWDTNFRKLDSPGPSRGIGRVSRNFKAPFQVVRAESPGLKLPGVGRTQDDEHGRQIGRILSPREVTSTRSEPSCANRSFQGPTTRPEKSITSGGGTALSASSTTLKLRELLVKADDYRFGSSGMMKFDQGGQ